MKYLLTVIILLLVAQTSLFGQSKSFRLSLAEAKQDNVAAQNKVGIAYYEGDGVRPNYKKAVYWFRRSAELGYAIGTCNLALHYWQGWGIRKDKTLAMKYVFAAHALDGLKCNPSKFFEELKPTECQLKIAWEAAVIWLRAHPNFKNNFDEQPWMQADGEYPVTFREGSSPSKLPVKSKKKCR
jgi:TPR repeat protein